MIIIKYLFFILDKLHESKDLHKIIWQSLRFNKLCFSHTSVTKIKSSPICCQAMYLFYLLTKTLLDSTVAQS